MRKSGSRRKLKVSVFNRESNCVACGEPATDLHEAFIPRGAVMAARQEIRDAIHHKYNCCPLCGQCNQNVTREIQVKARQWLCLQAGIEHYGGEGLASEADMMLAGAELIQMWVDSLGLKTKHRIKEMAGL